MFQIKIHQFIEKFFQNVSQYIISKIDLKSLQFFILNVLSKMFSFDFNSFVCIYLAQLLEK